jgi:hypothetical protein
MQKEKVTILVRARDVGTFRKFLLVSTRLSLYYLNDLFVEIDTPVEGKKFFQLGGAYKKTEILPKNGREYHFFQVMKDCAFVGADHVHLWKMKKERSIVGKIIYFF